MKHVFTNREKILLVILAVLLIAVGYWKLILTPINDSIDALRQQTASEQDALIQDSARAARLTQMKAELETLLSDPNAKPLPDFDNSEKLLVELNTILSGTDYTLNFANPTPLETGSAILARPISLTFEVSTYSAARAVLDALHDSQYVNLISDLNMDLKGSTVRTTLSLTYFELQKYPPNPRTHPLRCSVGGDAHAVERSGTSTLGVHRPVCHRTPCTPP